ncbi:MAG TPA: plasma-membrane proton-efflux P-type ATPase [Armatimonadota bacterium]|nr:plasma-membrane proton-efflux P-type ATPase [Armatimonadota bacterium]
MASTINLPEGGLTTQQAQARLRQYGPNAVPQQPRHPALLLLHKFWSPVPWMLEATLLLELILGKHTQAAIIGALLVLNAVLSFVQENRANNALALLRQNLTIQVRVLRDGRWQPALSQDLVPEDVIHVRMGDLIPADVVLQEGQILVDQSALTGESTPVEVEPGKTGYAGSTIRRGEATGVVTGTGQRTYYGKTAELVRGAGAPNHLETVIFTIIKYLIALDLFLVAAILAYAITERVSMAESVPFALILLIASVPVALPATYTLAGALGSLELARDGVLLTRLSAVEDAAAMDLLCSDKTGTITRNQLAVAALQAYPPHTEDDLLELAALACDESTQDPIDLAILDAAKAHGIVHQRQRLQFLPFDPATRRSEALWSQDKGVLRVVKGAPAVVAGLTSDVSSLTSDTDALAGQGYRVLAVASGSPESLEMAGLVALQDPPREDSRAVVQSLNDLGVRVIMVTGDGAGTAQAIAAQVGIQGHTCPIDSQFTGGSPDQLDCGVFAGVFPEDKFRLVRAYQHAGHVVGMTGDGVNDAPALKQAEVGIAVANATDVAKAAASLVLTKPGLTDVLAAVETGRRIYQRMLTYTLNKIIKTFQIALFLSLGLLLTGVFVTTPRLILLLLFANDFVTMSLASDRVTFSRQPDRWQMRPLIVTALILAIVWVVFCFAIFLIGRDVFHLDLPRLQTLVFLTLVFSGQATVYLVRERRHFWKSLPGPWLAVSSAADIVIVSILAACGILMTPIRWIFIPGLLMLIIAYSFLLDSLKIRLYRQFGGP